MKQTDKKSISTTGDIYIIDPIEVVQYGKEQKQAGLLIGSLGTLAVIWLAPSVKPWIKRFKQELKKRKDD